jgi:acyl carrier protein
MGLDFVEVLMEIEDRLDVELMSGIEWYPLHTAGTLSDVVWQRLQGYEPAITFDDYRQANATVEQVFQQRGVTRRWFVKDLNRLLPEEDREQIWSQLSDRLDCPLPELHSRGDGSVPTIPKVCSTKHDLVMWVLWHRPGHELWRPITPTQRTKPLGWPFKARRTDSSAKVPRSWTREEVWEEVRQILIEQLGLRPEEVVKDARLNEDIRLD